MEGKNAPTFKRFVNPYYELYPEGDYWEKLKPQREKTALLIIDVQKHYQGIASELKDRGHGYLYDRLNNLVIPNARKLLDFFRGNNLVVTFAAIGNQRADGRDRSPTQARPLDLGVGLVGLRGLEPRTS
ncbi:MAG TPA: hypothetical protein GX510_04605 [Firmicutes bacterium]|nr:hypothetical protein [Candidatus Fermentithermobacillaceae bacterium]